MLQSQWLYDNAKMKNCMPTLKKYLYTRIAAMLAVILVYSAILFIAITYFWDEKPYDEENTASENIFMIFFYVFLASVIAVFVWLIADVVKFQKKLMPKFRNTATVLFVVWFILVMFSLKSYFGV